MILELVQQEPSLFSDGIWGTNLMILVFVITFGEPAGEVIGTHKMIKMNTNIDGKTFLNFRNNFVLLVLNNDKIPIDYIGNHCQGQKKTPTTARIKKFPPILFIFS